MCYSGPHPSECATVEPPLEYVLKCTPPLSPSKCDTVPPPSKCATVDPTDDSYLSVARQSVLLVICRSV